MPKINIKNECIKRKFFRWLKGADGCCEATVNCIEKAILLYEDFTKQEDFSAFNPDKAIQFKEWLKKRQHKGKTISLVTYHTYLRYLRKFFTWLSWQSGYKSKINPSTTAYLRIPEKEERMATQMSMREFPPLEYVLKLADSIKIYSEIDLRDRALVAFTLLSGMRDSAIASLPLNSFNETTLAINQDPKAGVKTKFSKYIPSTLLNFNDRLLNYVNDWIKHLKDKGFGCQHPLFPRSKQEQSKDNLSFEEATAVEPFFWQSAGRIRAIFKRRCQEANLPYYPPHTFRHLAALTALEHCQNGKEIKAISQNFGHEYIATILSIYGNLQPHQLKETIKKIDFSDKPKETLEDKIDRLLNKIEKKDNA